jgi:hypothetical protein
MIFSVMEKLVSDAQKMGSASEKSFWVNPTVVSTTQAIALIVETMEFANKKIFSMAATMVFGINKILLVIYKIYYAI